MRPDGHVVLGLCEPYNRLMLKVRRALSRVTARDKAIEYVNHRRVQLR